MSLLQELEMKKNTNVSYTANGAISNASTLDPILDFFSKAGAMRGRYDEAVALFQKAYTADRNLALKALFYLRDIRGGQGERSMFRACLQWLEDNDAMALYKVLPLVSEYGRWDDLLDLRKGDSLGRIAELIKGQLELDEQAMANGESVSLMAKWLPTIKTSSAKTRKQAAALAELLGLKPSVYRKRVSALRKYIKLLEQKMSANQWAEIDYEKTPSQALRKHTKAFHRHDEQRFTTYLEAAQKGEKKMNTATLFAYEVYNQAMDGDTGAADAMWANLPDYTNGTNALVIADVSGSMMGLPMSISVSLALYFAERNQGAFNGYFLTFSERPKLQKIVGNTLTKKMQNIENSDWGMSTNLEAAFNAVLTAAKNAKASQDEVPSVIYVISDMQFNACVNGNNDTNFETARKNFTEAGYILPHVVFWNVNAWGNDSPATKYDKNITLISGSSQSAFQLAVEGKNPIELMMEVLGSKRYLPVSIEN